MDEDDFAGASLAVDDEAIRIITESEEKQNLVNIRYNALTLAYQSYIGDGASTMMYLDRAKAFMDFLTNGIAATDAT